MSAIHSDDAEIREAIAAYAETWNRHDMSALTALFAPEADFVTVTGFWWKGQQQIESNHASLHGQSPQGSAGATVPDGALGVFATSKVYFDEVVVRLVGKDSPLHTVPGQCLAMPAPPRDLQRRRSQSGAALPSPELTLILWRAASSRTSVKSRRLI